ncbi:hypothetical protein GUI12_01095 [Anaplasmataceae bacterium AB001_6]|nr:hypothetical protein GUI12_01095 [Anaplasmataceae bacterium AB001_6]
MLLRILSLLFFITAYFTIESVCKLNIVHAITPYNRYGFDCNSDRNRWPLYLGQGLSTGWSGGNRPDTGKPQLTCSSLIMNDRSTDHDYRVLNWEPSHSIMYQLPQSLNDGYIKVGFRMNEYYTSWFKEKYYGSHTAQSYGCMKTAIKPCQISDVPSNGCAKNSKHADGLLIVDCVDTIWAPRALSEWNTWHREKGGMKIPKKQSSTPTKITHLNVAAVYANCAVYDGDLKNSSKIIDTEQNWWNKYGLKNSNCKNRIRNDNGDLIAGIYGTFSYFTGSKGENMHIMCDDYPALFNNITKVTTTFCTKYNTETESNIFDCWLNEIFKPWADGNVPTEKNGKENPLHSEFRMCRQDVYPPDLSVAGSNRPLSLPAKTKILQEFVTRMSSLPKEEKRINRLKIELDYIFRHSCVCVLSRNQPSKKNKIGSYHPMLLTGERCVLMPVNTGIRTIKFPEFWQSRTVNRSYLSVPTKPSEYSTSSNDLVLNTFSKSSVSSGIEYDALRYNEYEKKIRDTIVKRTPLGAINSYVKQEKQSLENQSNELFNTEVVYNYSYRAPFPEVVTASAVDNQHIEFIIEGKTKTIGIGETLSSDKYNLKAFKANKDSNTGGIMLKTECSGVLIPDTEAISECEDSKKECYNEAGLSNEEKKECDEDYQTCMNNAQKLLSCQDMMDQCNKEPSNTAEICQANYNQCIKTHFINEKGKFGYYCSADNEKGQVIYTIPDIKSGSTNYNQICLMGWTPYINLSGKKDDDMIPLDKPLEYSKMDKYGFTSYTTTSDPSDPTKQIIDHQMGFLSRDYGFIDIGLNESGKEVPVYTSITNIPYDNGTDVNLGSLHGFMYDNSCSCFRPYTTSESSTYKRYSERKNFIELEEYYTPKEIESALKNGHISEEDIYVTDNYDEARNMIYDLKNKGSGAKYYIFDSGYQDFSNFSNPKATMLINDLNRSHLLKHGIPIADPVHMGLCKDVLNYAYSDDLLENGIVQIKFRPQFATYNQSAATGIHYIYKVGAEEWEDDASGNYNFDTYDFELKNEYYPNLKIGIHAKSFQLCSNNGVNYTGTKIKISYRATNGKQIVNEFCMPTHLTSGNSIGARTASGLGLSSFNNSNSAINYMTNNYIDPDLYKYVKGENNGLAKYWPEDPNKGNIIFMPIIPSADYPIDAPFDTNEIDKENEAAMHEKMTKVRLDYLFKKGSSSDELEYRRNNKFYCYDNKTKKEAVKNKFGYYVCPDNHILKNDVEEYKLPFKDYPQKCENAPSCFYNHPDFASGDGFLACRDTGDSIQILKSVKSLKKSNCPLRHVGDENLYATIDLKKLTNPGITGHTPEMYKMIYQDLPFQNNCMIDYQDQYGAFEVAYVPYTDKGDGSLEVNYKAGEQIDLLTMEARTNRSKFITKLKTLYYDHTGKIKGNGKNAEIYYKLEPVIHYLNINHSDYQYLKSEKTKNILKNVSAEQAEKYGAKGLDGSATYDLLATAFVGYSDSMVENDNYLKTTKHYVAYDDTDTSKYTDIMLPGTSCFIKALRISGAAANILSAPLTVKIKK